MHEPLIELGTWQPQWVTRTNSSSGRLQCQTIYVVLQARYSAIAIVCHASSWFLTMAVGPGCPLAVVITSFLDQRANRAQIINGKMVHTRIQVCHSLGHDCCPFNTACSSTSDGVHAANIWNAQQRVHCSTPIQIWSCPISFLDLHLHAPIVLGDSASNGTPLHSQIMCCSSCTWPAWKQYIFLPVRCKFYIALSLAVKFVLPNSWKSSSPQFRK